MLILSLKAINFMRFEKFSISDFPMSGIIGIFGENESGKSTVGELIAFALFGRTTKAPKGEKAKIIHWHKDFCETEITFIIDDKMYSIVRKIFKNENDSEAKLLSLNNDSAIVITDSVLSVEKKTETMLGFTFKDFRYSTYIAQGELDLILSSNEERKNVINNMAGAGFLEKVSKKIVKKRDSIYKTITNIKSDVAKLQNGLNEYQRLEKETKNITNKLGELNDYLLTNIRERDSIRTNLQLLEDVRKKSERLEFLESKMNQYREELKNIEQNIEQILSDLDSAADIKFQLQEKEMELKEIQEYKIPMIDQKLTLLNEGELVKKRMYETQAKIEKNKNSIAKLKESLETIQNNEKNLKILEEECRKIDDLLQYLSDKQNYKLLVERFHKDLARLNKQINSVKQSFKEEMNQLFEKEKKTFQKLEKIKKQIENSSQMYVDSNEMLKLKNARGAAQLKQNISFIMSIFFILFGIVSYSFLKSYFLYFGIAASAGALISFIVGLVFNNVVKTVEQNLQSLQQRLYAYNVLQQNISDMEEIKNDFEHTLMREAGEKYKLVKLNNLLETYIIRNFQDVKDIMNAVEEKGLKILERVMPSINNLLIEHSLLREIVSDTTNFETLEDFEYEDYLKAKAKRKEEMLSTIEEIKNLIAHREIVMKDIERISQDTEQAEKTTQESEKKLTRIKAKLGDKADIVQTKEFLLNRRNILKRGIYELKNKINRIQNQPVQLQSLKQRKSELLAVIDVDLMEFYELREASRGIDCSIEHIKELEFALQAANSKVSNLTLDIYEVTKNKKNIEEEFIKLSTVVKDYRKLQEQLRNMEVSVVKSKKLEELFLNTAQEIRKRLIPQIEAYFNWILPRMTKNRYQQVVIDANFDLKVFSYEKGDFVSLEALSGGTIDQLLISLRLAFARAMVSNYLSSEQFLFLDEPFSSFDEVRKNLFFAFLRTLVSEFHQIFLISHFKGLEQYVDEYIRVDIDSSHQPSICSWKSKVCSEGL